MKLIQIDSYYQVITDPACGSHSWNSDTGYGVIPVLPIYVDAETGVVYFADLRPRYDSSGKIMIIPKVQLPSIIERANARFRAEDARAAQKRRKDSTIPV